MTIIVKKFHAETTEGDYEEYATFIISSSIIRSSSSSSSSFRDLYTTFQDLWLWDLVLELFFNAFSMTLIYCFILLFIHML